MRLRKPCGHDRYEKHWIGAPDENSGALCPGGEFLPEDALVIENWEWPIETVERIAKALYVDDGYPPEQWERQSDRIVNQMIRRAEAALDAITPDQVGEPG